MLTPLTRPPGDSDPVVTSEVAHQLGAVLAVDPTVVTVEYPTVLLVGTRSDLGGAALPRGFHGLIVADTCRDDPERQDKTERRQDPPDVFDDQPDEKQHTDGAYQSTTGLTLLTAHADHHLRYFA